MEGELHIILILDESGSMDPIRKDIIGSFNKFIREQQDLKVDNKDKTAVTFIKFNDKITKIFEKEPLEKVKEIGLDDYIPGGCTALNDAVGTMIDKYSAEKNVCFVVITDGEENSSKKYTGVLIREKIDEKKDKGWNFIYLSSDLKTATQGACLGVRSSEQGCTTGENNVCVGYRGLSRGITEVVGDCVATIRTKKLMKGMGSKVDL